MLFIVWGFRRFVYNKSVVKGESFMDLNIKINKHSSICVDNDIYFDPYGITGHQKNAKVIFITHSHYDHLDMPSIKNIFNEDSVIVGPKDAIDMLREEGYDDENLKVVKPFESGIAYDIEFETFPSYNLNKKFHPKDNGWIGYTIVSKDIKYTVCGDSDNTPELNNIKTDVLFVPVGGTYTMTPDEAATLTNNICPKVAIPVHYGSIVGTQLDGQKFCDNINNSIKTIKLI